MTRRRLSRWPRGDRCSLRSPSSCSSSSPCVPSSTWRHHLSSHPNRLLVRHWWNNTSSWGTSASAAMQIGRAIAMWIGRATACARTLLSSAGTAQHRHHSPVSAAHPRHPSSASAAWRHCPSPAGAERIGDEDITANNTSTPSPPVIADPITCARARQLNHQVSSLLSSCSQYLDRGDP
jgi:hypothetical protein